MINLTLQIKLYKIDKSLTSSYCQVSLTISSLDSDKQQSPKLNLLLRSSEIEFAKIQIKN